MDKEAAGIKKLNELKHLLEPDKINQWRVNESMDLEGIWSSYKNFRKAEKIEHLYYCKSCKEFVCLLVAKIQHSSHDLLYVERHDGFCDCHLYKQLSQKFAKDRCSLSLVHFFILLSIFLRIAVLRHRIPL